MTQYIDKSSVIAEIERRIKEIEEIGTYLSPKGTLTNLLCYVKTIEVKEVDLEKEYKDFVEEDPVFNKLVNGIVGRIIAKHFFELGLKVQKGE